MSVPVRTTADGAPAVLVMAGGTGGHVFPALAMARELMSGGAEVSWLGTRRGLESRLVPEAGLPIAYVGVSGLRGKGWSTWLAAPFRLARAVWQALAIIRRLRPDLVLGMGGFVSGPGGLAAWLLRRPLVIHEQNAVPGLTNRLLSRLAGKVFEAFPGSFPASARAIHTGNPVRAELLAVPAPEQRLAGREGPTRVLVVGGSQGAQAINECLPRALAQLPEAIRPEVWHQAGARQLQATRAAYEQSGAEARVVEFIRDMAEAYAWADLVVCRSGAMTVAELTAVGVAAVLVPYPSAVDDHQTLNARFMTDRQAGVLLPQSELEPQRLAGLLNSLAADPVRRLAMARAARALARPDATHDVLRHCREYLHD